MYMLQCANITEDMVGFQNKASIVEQEKMDLLNSIFGFSCDTNGFGTNVNNLRHSISVSSILIRDIEDLVVTCNRASERILRF